MVEELELELELEWWEVKQYLKKNSNKEKMGDMLRAQ